MLGATALVAFVMLAAILIVAIGPVYGLMAWLFCLGITHYVLRRVRRHVWSDF